MVHKDFVHVNEDFKKYIANVNEWCSETIDKVNMVDNPPNDLEDQIKGCMSNLDDALTKLTGLLSIEHKDVLETLALSKEVWSTAIRLESHPKFDVAIKVHPDLLAALEGVKKGSSESIQYMEAGKPVPPKDLKFYRDSIDKYFDALNKILSALGEPLPPRNSN